MAVSRAWASLTVLVTAVASADPPSAFVPVDEAEARRLLIDAYDTRADGLAAALRRSIEWLQSSDAADVYPVEFGQVTVTREAMTHALRDVDALLREDATSQAWADAILHRFDVVSASLDEPVTFTAYYAPSYEASLERTERFRYPLYAIPDALAPKNESREVWHTRVEIEDDGLLAGRELAWLADPLDAYLVHVNGSGQLRLPDGEVRCVGHVATNERSYTSLGRMLIEAGIGTPGTMTLDVIREAYEDDPDLVLRLMRRNDRYVFFEFVDADAWPRSSLGVALTPRASIASDRSLHPAGGLVLVDTTLPTEPEATRFTRLMLDQDSGGAITGAFRVDLYLGVGDEAGRLAGRTVSAGRLLLLRPRATPW